MQYRMEESSKNNVNTDQTVFVGHTEKNKSHSDEVTIMLTKEAEKALINWEALNCRIIKATFRITEKNVHINLIQCYTQSCIWCLCVQQEGGVIIGIQIINLPFLDYLTCFKDSYEISPELIQVLNLLTPGPRNCCHLLKHPPCLPHIIHCL